MTHQVQFALQADKILALKDVSVIVITLRVIDSDSTKTHIQLRWLYLYCVQRHTGAR